MKNIEQSQFLQVLKAALWNSPSNGVVLPMTSGEWEALLQEARRQTVEPLLFNWLSAQSDLALSKGTLHRLLAQSVRNRQMHQCLRRTLNELDTMLQGIGVHGALLKGEGVATLYPDPDSRACGDIDFMVGPTDYERVCQFLRERGMVDSMATESEKHLHFTMNGSVPIEIHRVAAVTHRFWRSKAFQNWLTDNLQPRDAELPRGQKVRLPGVTFDAFFLFYHAYYHFLTGGIGIRQLCDWTLHLNKYADEINAVALQEILDQLHLRKVWNAFATIAVRELGLASNRVPFYTEDSKSADFVLDIIFEDGNFGFYNEQRKQRPKGYFSGKLFTVKCHTERLHRLISLTGLDSVLYYGHMLSMGIQRVIHHK